MKKEKILKNNKLIADFIGIEVKSLGMTTYLTSPSNLHWMIKKVNKLIDKDVTLSNYEYYYKFHKSWDWLMPAVEKIERINKDNEDFIINGSACYVPDIHKSITRLSKIKATYKGVIKFIKHYNKLCH